MFEEPLVKYWGEEARVTASIIWLHGLGADCHDFEPFVDELNIPVDKSVRFIFPNAPVRPVTINGGMRMRAWYDIAVDVGGFSTNGEHLKQSADYVDQLIREQVEAGIPLSRIFVAGFSQGGAVVLYAALRSQQELAGVIALSTYLPLREEFGEPIGSPAQSIDVFMGHGTADPLIAIHRALESKEILQRMGVNVSWHQYSMAHSVCMDELRDLSRWLISRL